jgi:hypothetical protein
VLHHQGYLWRREGGKKSRIDRGKQGVKRSTLVDGNGTPLGAISAPARAVTTHRFWKGLWTLWRS